ncbi:708_t:CDS:2, partial [Acaulospora colombiana]
MDGVKVPGIENLKKDFEAAKKFIFDAVANSNFQALDVHLEFEEPLRTPDVPTPDAPRLGPISLPPMTPLGTPGPVTPSGVETRWPSMLTDENGLMYRIVATPRDLAYDAIGYFQSIVIPPTPNANASMDPAKEQKPSPVDRPAVPVADAARVAAEQAEFNEKKWVWVPDEESGYLAGWVIEEDDDTAEVIMAAGGE